MSSDDESDDRQVAEIVMYWMRRRGLTRQVFADRLGRSLSWVDKIKKGDRQLDRLSVLRQIARVLDVPLQVLIGPEEAERRRQCPDDGDISAVRSALRRYDAITNVFRPNGDGLPEPNLGQLGRRVRYGWMAFQVSNYQVVGQLLAGSSRRLRQRSGSSTVTTNARLRHGWPGRTSSLPPRPTSSVTRSSGGSPQIAVSSSPSRPAT